MTSLSGIGYNGYNPSSVQQSLFNEIDTSGHGLITKSELEQAVTAAGGTSTAADSLFAELDPNSTGSDQEFSQDLPALPLSDQMGAQMIGLQAQGWPGGSGTNPSSAFAQNLLLQINTDGDGSISRSELGQAVTSAGGASAAAEALYAALDLDNTGSVSDQQLAQFLKPVSQTGAAAQEAALALHHPTSRSPSAASTTGDSRSTGSSSASVLLDMGNDADTGAGKGSSGSTARDALLALLNDSLGPGLSALGGSIQDPLLARAQGTGTGPIFESAGSMVT